MTTTSALTCRTAADRSSDPAGGRPAIPAAAPTAIPRWTYSSSFGCDARPLYDSLEER